MSELSTELSAVQIERLRVGMQMAVSDALGKSLEVDTYRDASLRMTLHSFTAWFASRQIFEDVQTVERVFTWRDRLRILFGKPITETTHIIMRHNCPHLPMEDAREHVAWLVGQPQ